MYLIEIEEADQYSILNGEGQLILDAADDADWSVVADMLLGRLKSTRTETTGGEDRYHRKYYRDKLTNRAADALKSARREGEVRALYEAEIEATGNYVRLVDHLIELKQADEAERRAVEGIAATSEKWPGMQKNWPIDSGTWRSSGNAGATWPPTWGGSSSQTPVPAPSPT